jgi:hypothetical protein
MNDGGRFPIEIGAQLSDRHLALGDALDLERPVGRHAAVGDPSMNRLPLDTEHLGQLRLSADQLARARKSVDGSRHTRKGKALLSGKQALPTSGLPPQSGAMQTAADIAAKLRAELDDPEAGRLRGLTAAGLAEATDQSRQSVYSWLKTGRIHKRHLPAICRYFGKPLAWLWDADEFDAETIDFAREFSTLTAPERRRWMMAILQVKRRA